jgi:Esterase/lipase
MHIESINLYQDREDATLTTYVLEDSPELLKGGKRPAILICPGGAYLGCSDREAEPIALRYAAMGYHAFVLRYSTYYEGTFANLDFSKEPVLNENCVHPNPMLEIGKSILIIREHAEEWLVDTDKIALCGFSAGAHNCAMYASYWHTSILSEHYQKDSEVFKPAAAILGYMVSDYVFMKDYVEKMDLMEKTLFNYSVTALLGTTTPDLQQLDEVSPARHVTEKYPPTFIWSTAGDKLVPIQHSIRMAHALADHQVPFELHIFEEGEHGLSLATQATASNMDQINEDAAKWVELSEAWLKKRMELLK